MKNTLTNPSGWQTLLCNNYSGIHYNAKEGESFIILSVVGKILLMLIKIRMIHY